MRKVILAALLILPLLMVGTVSFAQTGVQQAPTLLKGGFSDILAILSTLINWAFTILLVVAVFYVFFAAYLYLTAAGDAEKVRSANNQLIYAAVAIGVALIAQGIQFIVRQLVGA